MHGMHARASQLITSLRLAPHPEGGHYREVFRSADRVQPADGRPLRSALTNILFLLAAGEGSRWHRVTSDEVWHCYEGEGVELLVAPPRLEQVARIALGKASATTRPAYTIPAGWWQAARPLGSYALVGCTVAPGFDFADFSFLRDDAELAARLATLDPDSTTLL
jgi:predicted cupin superfamily sugar epimerase